MNLSDFDYELPAELIAQHPLPERDASRLLVVDRARGTWQHRRFGELPDLLDPNVVLAVNTTRVLPARLWARHDGRARPIEALLVHEEAGGAWRALLKPARRVVAGAKLHFGALTATCTEVRDSGERVLAFDDPGGVRAHLEQFGSAPLPPYIRRPPGERRGEDVERYQTVFARTPGSIAAPTAGLHFTPEVLERLAARPIPVCEIVLHVGYGTFQPIRTERVEDHVMHGEYYEIAAETAGRLAAYQRAGKRLVAVGTTTTRALEQAAASGEVRAETGWSDLFIYPGYRFRAVNGLVTNFHLPRSSLLLLVSALAGRELILAAYRAAVEARYRFFSYGDCMLIL